MAPSKDSNAGGRALSDQDLREVNDTLTRDGSRYSWRDEGNREGPASNRPSYDEEIRPRREVRFQNPMTGLPMQDQMMRQHARGQREDGEPLTPIQSLDINDSRSAYDGAADTGYFAGQNNETATLPTYSRPPSYATGAEDRDLSPAAAKREAYRRSGSSPKSKKENKRNDSEEASRKLSPMEKIKRKLTPSSRTKETRDASTGSHESPTPTPSPPEQRKTSAPHPVARARTPSLTQWDRPPLFNDDANMTGTRRVDQKRLGKEEAENKYKGAKREWEWSRGIYRYNSDGSKVPKGGVSDMKPSPLGKQVESQDEVSGGDKKKEAVESQQEIRKDSSDDGSVEDEQEWPLSSEKQVGDADASEQRHQPPPS
ncbi:uncharacterized protein LTR77_010098 [Saxophila tyrrhenica]|uniref:Uncharacterized protein n=1 Tax=Saxophila tyrrhenica TaxID=1690608 RepID=A0AAV9NZN3_9PEZI|nr:hypothetical protein LTR77_010098 [Saxophila tyrrhenica]